MQDIRFLVFQHKHASTAAFKQEKSGPLGRLRRSFRSKLRGRAAESTKLPSDEVLQGKDMNIEQSGAVRYDTILSFRHSISISHFRHVEQQ